MLHVSSPRSQLIPGSRSARCSNVDSSKPVSLVVRQGRCVSGDGRYPSFHHPRTTCAHTHGTYHTCVHADNNTVDTSHAPRVTGQGYAHHSLSTRVTRVTKPTTLAHVKTPQVPASYLTHAPTASHITPTSADVTHCCISARRASSIW